MGLIEPTYGPSAEAQRLDDFFRSAPSLMDLDVAEQRAAIEHAEDLTSEPTNVAWSAEPAVDGLWADPGVETAGRIVLYLFGGGFVFSAPANRRKFSGHLALASSARVLVPNLRLAPEDPFPAALDDAMTAYRWLLDQGNQPSRIVIAGDSSGGGLAISTLLAIRDQALPRPAGAVVLSPWADLAFTGTTYDQLAESDLTVTVGGLRRMADQYLAGFDPRTPLASPMYAELGGLPPLLIVVGGHEILLDDSLRLAKHAALAQVDVTLQVAPWMQHIFPFYVGAMPEADAAVQVIGGWIQRRIG